MLCIVELVGNGLINGYGDRLSGGISCVARVNSDGFFFHWGAAPDEARCGILKAIYTLLKGVTAI